MLRKAIDWILLTRALADARARLAADEQRAGVHLQQARLVAEVIKRVAEPAETLPPGNPAAVIIALGREAVASLLAAMPPVPAAEGVAAPTSLDPLAQALDQAPQEALLGAVPDAAALGSVKETLLTHAPAAVAQITPEQERAATRVRSFVEALLWNGDAPRRQVDRLLVFRFARLALVGVVLALLALGILRMSMGSNLAEGKPFKTSSNWSGCPTDPMCEGRLLFHTNEENQPWAEFDLLEPEKIHLIEVKNRPDAFGDRIVPLVIEVSVDGKQWSEVGRKTEDFATWTLKFPARQARYIKLHVARQSILHIKELTVR